MAIYAVKPLFQKSLKPLADLFTRLKVHPTVINLLALGVSLTAGILLFFRAQFTFFLLILPLLFFIRIAFNALDGMVARALKVSSARGEIYNEFIDRISDVVIFGGLAFSFITQAIGGHLTWSFVSGGEFPAGMVLIILLLLNSYLGILSKSAGGERIYSGFIGKADRMFYLGLFCLIYYFYPHYFVWPFFYLFVIIGTVISIGQRLWQAVKSLKN